MLKRLEHIRKFKTQNCGFQVYLVKTVAFTNKCEINCEGSYHSPQIIIYMKNVLFGEDHIYLAITYLKIFTNISTNV